MIPHDPTEQNTSKCHNCGETVVQDGQLLIHWNTGKVECAPEPNRYKCIDCGHTWESFDTYDECEECESQKIYENSEIEPIFYRRIR